MAKRADVHTRAVRQLVCLSWWKDSREIRVVTFDLNLNSTTCLIFQKQNAENLNNTLLMTIKSGSCLSSYELSHVNQHSKQFTPNKRNDSDFDVIGGDEIERRELTFLFLQQMKRFHCILKK
ncbi:hypothetical protein HELRODRAFT_166996 [Helobdella robusta]|uniref:Uncharacterized protein n=1 Tax=Helobdella robusta TaxID=6412 RepID=T1EYV0_HELRO|nr:hypothetical protein HELRODRAFT_166996 [Helobdella robusta]ESO11903.1 hypothetical protein HELRODRAFT_166996 [Helobdella robusta]